MNLVKSLVLLCFMFTATVGLASTTTPLKTTLTHERITVIKNGTANGLSITSHSLQKRFHTEKDCEDERKILELENELSIGPSELKAHVLNIVSCEALDHRFQIQYQ